MNIPIAKDIMTSDILAADVDWSVNQLAEFFEEHNISGAPVTDRNGSLVGVVSLMDIVRHDSTPVQDSRTHDYYLRNLKKSFDIQEIPSYRIRGNQDISVIDIMTPMIFDIEESTPVPDIADTMLKGHIHRIFVTREKRIVGIISSLDLLKVVRDLSQFVPA